MAELKKKEAEIHNLYAEIGRLTAESKMGDTQIWLKVWRWSNKQAVWLTRTL